MPRGIDSIAWAERVSSASRSQCSFIHGLWGTTPDNQRGAEKKKNTCAAMKMFAHTSECTDVRKPAQTN